MLFSFFFFNDTATTEIYTLSLHDALPIFNGVPCAVAREIEQMQIALAGIQVQSGADALMIIDADNAGSERSEEHTSELQSRSDLVCRLLLEKKKEVIIVNVL